MCLRVCFVYGNPTWFPVVFVEINSIAVWIVRAAAAHSSSRGRKSMIKSFNWKQQKSHNFQVATEC